MKLPLKNAVFNFGGLLIPICVTLLTIPFYLKVIGTERYGVISFVWIIVGFMGFLDFGMARATTNFLSKTSLGNEYEQISSQYVLSSLIFNATLGILGAVIFYNCGDIIIGQVRSSSFIGNELRESVPIISLFIPLTLATPVLTGALDAHGRFLAANFIQTTGTIAFQIVPLCVAYLGYNSLTDILSASLLVRASTFCVQLIFCIRTNVIKSWRVAPINETMRLYSYGGWIAITSISNQVLGSADQYFITTLFGAAENAGYAIAFSMTNKLSIIPAAVARSIFPIASRSNREEAFKISDSAQSLVGYTMALICAQVILLGPVIIPIWMNNPHSFEVVRIVCILVFGIWINSLSYFPITTLQAIGAPGTVARIQIVALFPSLIMLYYFVNHFHVQGAAYAWVIRAMAEFIIFSTAIGKFGSKILLLLAPSLMALFYFFLPARMALETRLLLDIGLTSALLAWIYYAYGRSWLNKRNVK